MFRAMPEGGQNRSSEARATRGFAAKLTLVFFLLELINILHHALWEDEMQVRSFAQHSHSLGNCLSDEIGRCPWLCSLSWLYMVGRVPYRAGIFPADRRHGAGRMKPHQDSLCLGFLALPVIASMIVLKVRFSQAKNQ